MLVVQVFEQHLGFLWVWHSIPEDSASRRDLKGGIRRTVHALQRASATEMRNGLREKLDEALLDEISRLVAWRHVLAHSYLRERFRSGPPEGGFAVGTYAELLGLLDDFSDAAGQLEELVDTETASIEEDIAAMPDDLVELMESIGGKLMRRDPA